MAVVWQPESLDGHTPELFVNESDASLLVALEGLYKDLDGNTVSGSFELAAYSSRVLVPVPEPATLGWLVLGGAFFLGRRRKNGQARPVARQ